MGLVEVSLHCQQDFYCGEFLPSRYQVMFRVRPVKANIAGFVCDSPDYGLTANSGVISRIADPGP